MALVTTSASTQEKRAALHERVRALRTVVTPCQTPETSVNVRALTLDSRSEAQVTVRTRVLPLRPNIHFLKLLAEF